jgi:excisionase family DNA binding protein
MTRSPLPLTPRFVSAGRRRGGLGEPAPQPVPPVLGEMFAEGPLGRPGSELLINVDEAARRLGIGRSHIYRYIDNGRLRSVRLGRSRRVAPQDLEAFVEEIRAAGMA